MTHKLIKDAAKLLPKNASKGLKDFLSGLYENVPEEDMAMMDSDIISSTAQIHWDLLRDRKQGQANISIQSPEIKEDDGSIGTTYIDVVSDDMAFVVDSVAAEISRHNKIVHLLIHPITHAQYDKKGEFKSTLKKNTDEGRAVSHIHIELVGAMPEALMKELKSDIQDIIEDVYFATRDWIPMRDKLRKCQKALGKAPSRYSDEEIEEYLSFLEYMYKDNFTLLGYREYKFTEKKGEVASTTVKGKSLGLFSNEIKPVYINDQTDGLPQDLQIKRHNLKPINISKVNRLSTVHRRVPLDAVAVKQYNDKGEVIGECLFVGLFTSVTYSRSIQDVPFLRWKADMVMHKSGFEKGSHDYKALRHILEKYPRDELFQIEIETLLETTLSILRLQERQRIALYLRHDPFGRFVSCLVYVPRERYDTHLRVKMQDILEEELKGTSTNFYTSLDDSPLARVLYTVQIDQTKKPKCNVAKIEARLQEAGRIWSERLEEALVNMNESESKIAKLVHKYGHAFPAGYREHYEPKQAVFDLPKLEESLNSDCIATDLYHSKDCKDGQMRVKIYHRDTPIPLSNILPILEHMGLEVISELPFKIKPNGGKKIVWIHDFLTQANKKTSLKNIDDIKENFEDALIRIWHQHANNDRLNRLVIGADLTWNEITILRCYLRFLRQAKYPLSLKFTETSLTNHPKISRLLLDMFFALHDPSKQKDSIADSKDIAAKIEAEMEKVASLDEDRVLRSVFSLIEATMRTNYFQREKDGSHKTYLSMKFDSGKIKDLPAPRPYREIFVLSPRVEGVHLRGDVIARGGLRWSDRHEDFRTEVLGLMKAQQVKNSLIVPMGAKGGFVVKRPPTSGGREAFLAEGIECYKTFLRGLLDITDNRKGTKIIPPQDVVRRDGDDPYLVVAADKGTATFSDIANSLSLEYSHWLGDAFASGGSAGYDHKAMGITARGAWESVKRHFRELSHDTQSQDFEVIGVGDMGGDVFGNGMLLSEHIRLIGAFNHLHIFCDPDPDPKSTFKERQRLFDNVKGWGDYDKKKLSKGGRIYLRSDKSLELTPEIQKKFGIESARVSPNELMQAMLKARTDLMWFGGIGTYIKSCNESHSDVGDKSNDSIRINARDLKARVLGEGANLAITQLGRIEFAQQGGKVNADFIDNSGGVNSSDVEVNIKILLADVMRQKKHNMTLPKRNKLLEKMTEEVAQIVLYNNYQQAQGISLMEMQATQNLPKQERYIEMLEREEGLDRELEGLPSDEAIEELKKNGKGLTRPELSIIQAYSKISYSRALLDSDIPELDEVEDRWLFEYFPKPLRKKYESEIKNHRLRREIIATSIAMGVINRMGPAFIEDMASKTGATYAEITKAYIIVRESFDLRSLWKKIEELDNTVPAEVQLRAMKDITNMVRRETLWFLTRLGRPPEIKKDYEQFSSGVKELNRKLDKVVPDDIKLAIEQRKTANLTDGLPEDLAHQIALIPTLGAACDIIRISRDCETDIGHTARVYYGLNSHFHLNWMRKQARFMESHDRWSAEALNSLIEQLYQCQALLTAKLLEDMKVSGKKPGRNTIDEWLSMQGGQMEQIRPFFASMRKSGSLDIPMLVIAVQRLQNLYNG
jgi:glutamate dehydrogenase